MTKVSHILLKVGRNTYEITEQDEFMDNGACIQLLTQSKEKSHFGHKPNPVLSKRAINELNAFKRVEHRHTYGDDVSVFSIVPEILKGQDG